MAVNILMDSRADTLKQGCADPGGHLSGFQKGIEKTLNLFCVKQKL